MKNFDQLQPEFFDYYLLKKCTLHIAVDVHIFIRYEKVYHVKVLQVNILFTEFQKVYL